MIDATAVPQEQALSSSKAPGKDQTLNNVGLAIAGVVVIVALVVISASFRMTERAISRAVTERETASRFLAEELSVLRLMAVSSESPVPARLYLGIEECFQKNVAVPFESPEAGRRMLAACGQMSARGTN